MPHTNHVYKIIMMMKNMNMMNATLDFRDSKELQGHLKGVSLAFICVSRVSSLLMFQLSFHQPAMARKLFLHILLATLLIAYLES